MQMDLLDKKYIKATIEFCKELDGKEKSEFINEAMEDYEFALTTGTPLLIQRRFRELFTELVKTFGH